MYNFSLGFLFAKAQTIPILFTISILRWGGGKNAGTLQQVKLNVLRKVQI
jgi:hypothetical protein